MIEIERTFTCAKLFDDHLKNIRIRHGTLDNCKGFAIDLYTCTVLLYIALKTAAANSNSSTRKTN